MDSATPPVVLPRPDHPISRKLIDPDALWILRRLRREGYLAYLVGGAVRDLMLGQEPKDFDIGTDARPSEIRRLFRNCRLIGRRFRLAHIYFRRKGEREKIMEVATFRGRGTREGTGGVPPEDLDLSGNVFGSPEEDAWRRDFTVNGLFYNLDDFSVIDHVGGLADLEAGCLRLIGAPDDRFEEDPVRMLRAVEFAVRLGFRIDPEMEAGILRNAGRIAEASPARLREEFRQLEQRGIAAEAFAEAHRLGLFEVLFPEVVEVEGVFPMLDHLDARAGSSGRPAGEAAYIAALAMPTVARACPLVPGVALDAAQAAMGPVVGGLTRRYQISAHIRHQAKELLLSCYRITRGRAYRTKGRFVKKPEFSEAWGFFQAWAAVTGALDDTVAYWEAYLAGQQTGGARAGKRRRRRRRRGGGGGDVVRPAAGNSEG